MEYVFEPPQRPAVPVIGGGLFPVRRIFCVGRNYAAHAREMGQDPEREPPFFFTKPADAVLPVPFGSEGLLPYADATADLQHELELVVALGAGGRQLTAAQAADCVFGYAVGLDMTRRDLQAVAKAKGQPWDAGKAFDLAAPLSHIVPRGTAPLLAAGEVVLELGEAGAAVQRQRGDLSDMLWPIAPMLARLSALFELRAGDLIFTGTPEGVGPVQPGDLLRGRIAGVGELWLRIGAARP